MNITEIITTIGIPAIILVLIYIGRKLQILDDLKEAVRKIKNNLKVVSDVLTKSDLTGFDGSGLETYSPIRITDIGRELLEEAGFIKLFSEHRTQRGFF